LKDILEPAIDALRADRRSKPPTVMEIIKLSTEIDEAGLGLVDFARAVLERWGHR
jgi:hypothetical protein